jgi:hypothetical protein
MKRFLISAAVLLSLGAAASAQPVQQPAGPVEAFVLTIANGTAVMVTGAFQVVASPFELVRPVFYQPPAPAPLPRHRKR